MQQVKFHRKAPNQIEAEKSTGQSTVLSEIISHLRRDADEQAERPIGTLPSAMRIAASWHVSGRAQGRTCAKDSPVRAEESALEMVERARCVSADLTEDPLAVQD